ncbi:hypothetical protein CK203_084187 [Vitis vinifera]|uniref:Uncharacterized protein n=1 Tax=Vitis vinifera TaxID=29760 RepID=A0A438DR88_VITVI|nr:hypothetical protein CK203_084187 [Vitis vinifera]
MKMKMETWLISADEEDGEGYKCGDGNDDDDDFVDLEEE